METKDFFCIRESFFCKRMTLWRWLYPKLSKCPSPQGIHSPPNTRFLGSTWVHTTNGTSISWAVFEGLMVVSNRQTHTHTHTHRDTMLHLQRQVAALQLTWAAIADCPHIWNTRRVSFAWHYSLSLSWQSTINTQPQLFRKSTRAETTTVKIIRSWSSTSMHIQYATLMCAQKLT